MNSTGSSTSTRLNLAASSLPLLFVAVLLICWGGRVDAATSTNLTKLEFSTSQAGPSNATAEGHYSWAPAEDAHAEGANTWATGYGSHSEGRTSTATGYASHAEGGYTAATGTYTHAEGYGSVAGGANAHAEGNGSAARGENAHAEGHWTAANSTNAHAEGETSQVFAPNGHAGGAYAKVQPEHTNAFIHATGVSTNYKQTQYRDTAHFDRLFLFESANDHSNSVLARWQNDQRYATSSQGARADSSLQPNTNINTYNLTSTGTITAVSFAGNGAGLTAVNATQLGGLGSNAFVKKSGDSATNLSAKGNFTILSAWNGTDGGVIFDVLGGSGLWRAAIAQQDSGAGDVPLKFFTSINFGGLTERMSISSYGDVTVRTNLYVLGGVGIGTNSPAAPLHVTGYGRFDGGVRFPAQGDISMGAFTSGSL